MLYMSVINCFGIEMVLCDLYFKTKGLLLNTFIFTVWYKLVYEKMCRRPKILWNKMRRRQD